MQRAAALLSVITSISLVGCGDASQPAAPIAASATSFASAVIPGSGTWLQRANMPGARNSSGGAVLNDRLYVLGGADDGINHYTATLYRYNPNTNAWATKAPVPIALGFPAVAAFQGKLYVMGGVAFTNFYNYNNKATYIYDPVLNSWSNGPTLPVGIYQGQAVSCGGALYVLGGDSFTADDGFYVFRPATNRWKSLGHLPVPRSNTQAECIRENIYVTGGEGDGLVSNDSLMMLDIYSTVTGAWSPGTAGSVFGPTRAIEAGGIMYLFKIYTNGEVIAYDPKADAWTTLATAAVSSWDAVLGSIDGTIYSAASADNTVNGATDATWAFTPAFAGNHAPTIAVTGPYSGHVGIALQWDGSTSSDVDGDVLQYAWKFGDGATSTVAAPSHTYSSANTYSLTLKVTDSHGVSRSTTRTVTIRP